MRLALLATTLLVTATAALAQNPPADRWHAKAREIYAHAIGVPTVQGRAQVPQLAEYLAGLYREAGITDVQVRPYGETAGLTVRWPAAHPSGRKAILLMAHMDVVPAHRADWERDPFTLVEEDGFFYGRGSADNKSGLVTLTETLLQLRRENFRPTRDLIVAFTGDEETLGLTATMLVRDHRDLIDAEYALNTCLLYTSPSPRDS